MKTDLIVGEVLLKKSRANAQRGWEAVGGQLFLTNKRLIFESHGYNVQRGISLINLGDITKVTPSWTRAWGIFPAFPNSIRVETNDGKRYEFICWGRGDWISKIEAAKKGLA